jgi:DnaJ domain
MPTDPDYYELLEIPVNAKPKEIIATYRRLARQFHPDVVSDPAAIEYMRTLNRAVEVLGDPEKRKEYDRQRLQALAREALAGESGARGSATRPPTPPRPSTGVPLSRAMVHRNTAVGRPIVTPAKPTPIKPPIFPALVSTAFALGALLGIAILTLFVSGDSPEPAAQTESTINSQPSHAASPSATPAVAAAVESPDPSTTNVSLVGEQISPGIWRAVRPESCSWRRMASAEVSDNDVIAAGSWLTVEIQPSDVAFWSEGCGGWSQNLEPPSASPGDPFGPGTWLIGGEVAPGLWQNSDSSQGCSWARLGKLDGGPSAMTSSGSTSSTTIVIALGARDVAFDSRGCGTWTRISS